MQYVRHRPLQCRGNILEALWRCVVTVPENCRQFFVHQQRLRQHPRSSVARHVATARTTCFILIPLQMKAVFVSSGSLQQLLHTLLYNYLPGQRKKFFVKLHKNKATLSSGSPEQMTPFLTYIQLDSTVVRVVRVQIVGPHPPLC